MKNSILSIIGATVLLGLLAGCNPPEEAVAPPANAPKTAKGQAEASKAGDGSKSAAAADAQTRSAPDNN